MNERICWLARKQLHILALGLDDLVVVVSSSVKPHVLMTGDI